MGTFKKIIVFHLNNQEYGADVSQILSIERISDIVELPDTPAFINGIIHLRGMVIPVIDLKKRLKMDRLTYTDETRVLIVEMDNHQIGLVVDKATDVLDINEDIIEPAGNFIRQDSDYLHGVAKMENRLLLLLDLEKVLSGEETKQVKEVIAG
ncbi:chemotaxis protein CheW [Sediminibacillus albus]|uniref:Purine-binding chemotaxis protein CheW n=1 Tax=Sediminibacillus albus TaxID=407036 RepID=A0A1G8YVR2_9BACI|nr:chemotaxis protein CheW [Sediminibacillus albus]SDK06524.1 purine-binding chemotaxis protein CheW [Sediminibacillus albus]